MDNSFTAEQLKSIFDELMVVPLSAYERLFKFLKQESHSTNTVLQQAGIVEEHARYLLQGVVGQFFEGKLIRLYFPHQIIFDREAYMGQKVTPYTFKAMTPVQLYSLSRANELRVLVEIPEITDMAGELKKTAFKSDQDWIKLTQMHYSDSYIKLNNKIKNYDLSLTEEQWAGLLGIDSRTFRRYKSQLYKRRNTILVRIQQREILQYPFESKTHPHAEEIEDMTLLWALQARLLTSSAQRKKFRSQKLAWLSAKLYPEASLKVSTWIATLYTWLFILDDHTDQLEKGQKEALWKRILEGFLQIRDEQQRPATPMEKFLSVLSDRCAKLKSMASAHYYAVFLDVLHQYITGNLWEAKNKDRGIVPSVTDYLEYRPVFSGGNLALQLIPFTLEQEFPEIHAHWGRLSKLVTLASQLIYITNDLISLEKERRTGDHHNWVRLLAIHHTLSEAEGKDYLIQEHEKVLKQFLETEQRVGADYDPVNRCLYPAIKAIKYQVSGTVDWSVIVSKRYRL